MARNTGRAFYLFSGLLMVAGTVIFMNGGRQHPPINESMGQFGTPEFFFRFASLIANDPHWEQSHAQIILGPVLWAIGVLGLADLLRSRGEPRWSMLAVVSLAMGVSLHVVLYIFDGFVASKIAPQLLGSDATLRPAFTSIFGANQWVVIRMSTVSWMLISIAPAALAIGLAATVRRAAGLERVLGMVLVPWGILLGAVAFIALATGSYSPGPMVSPIYVPVAITTALWFAVAGLSTLAHRPTRHRTEAPDEHRASTFERVPSHSR